MMTVHFVLQSDFGQVNLGHVEGFLFLPVGGDVVVDVSGAMFPSSSISGNIGLDPGPHRFSVTKGFNGIPPILPELTISAVISQTSSAADVIKDGRGEMRLERANTFTGSLTVNDGTLTVSNKNSLGTSAGGTIVNGNGSLALDGNGLLIANEALTMNSRNVSALHVVSRTNTWTRPIILSRDTAIDISPANPVGNFQALNNVISGPGGLLQRGPGVLILSGSAANTYGGITTVAQFENIGFQIEYYGRAHVQNLLRRSECGDPGSYRRRGHKANPGGVRGPHHLDDAS
jgi:autotransporter-associated beta strand protein